MSKSVTKTVVITMGDPRGIGPEVIRKAFASKRLARLANYVCIGDAKLLSGVPASIRPVSYEDPGEGSLRFLQEAVRLIKARSACALVTAPLSKEAVSRYQPDFRGHTEFLAGAFKVKRFDMMFVGEKVRLSLVTRHVPLKDVSPMITTRKVMDSILLMDLTLRRKFKISRPRIAVLGLNPHAGDGGLLGTEDQDRIAPAIAQARNKGLRVEGPLPADTFFAYGRSFDGVVAMYHDQGLAPVKALYFKDLVNFTAGLPFVRTSPVHGTAFDIAGKNAADPSSMMAAIELACQLA